MKVMLVSTHSGKAYCTALVYMLDPVSNRNHGAYILVGRGNTQDGNAEKVILRYCFCRPVYNMDECWGCVADVFLVTYSADRGIFVLETTEKQYES